MMVGDGAIIQKVQTWVRDFVSVKNPKLGHFPPCPFAKNAILQKQTQWFVNSSGEIETTKKLIEQASTAVEQGAEIGIVIHTDFKTWGVAELDHFVNEWRQEHLKRDVYLMRDHPEDVEWVGDVCMNQGDYLLFFLQPKARLLAARVELEKMGYYQRWTNSEVESVQGSCV